jgi:HAE1 family hydrophobic/amphiphilic exporter-1
MTTSAIIAGLIPTALGLGIGGTGRAAIAVTIIGGQALCLLLTLLLVPVGYLKLDQLEQSVANQQMKARLRKAVGATLGRLRPPSGPVSDQT